ncbi:MAG: LptF/LptG family permease [Nitrospiraceae bacterium]|nr:LptF/LptG family permease [Nitrospiraceae bacterium]
MKTIHKSVLKELVWAMIISLPLLNFILMMEKVLRLSRLLSSVGASPGELLRIILYIQPELMLLTLPMAFLLSVLYVYGRMNADNELVILKSSGMPFRQAAVPVFILGAAAVALSFFVSFHLGPAGRKDVRLSISETLRKRAPNAIEPGIFNGFIKNTVIYASSVKNGDLSGVFIYDERNPGRPIVIYAKSASIKLADSGSSIFFNLKNGLASLVKGPRLTEIFFGEYRLVLPLGIEGPEAMREELTPRQLLAKAATETGAHKTISYLEFYRRLTFPLFSLAIMFLAPALSLYAGKKARLGGLALGTAVFSVYYALLIYFEKLAQSGKIPAVAGGWAPFVILFTISVLVFRKVDAR